MSVQYAGLVMIAESAYANYGIYPRPEAICHVAECALVCDSYDEAEEMIEQMVSDATDALEMEF